MMISMDIKNLQRLQLINIKDLAIGHVFSCMDIFGNPIRAIHTTHVNMAFRLC